MTKSESKAIFQAMEIMMDPSMRFDKKLQEVLKFVIGRMKSKSGSIMILEEDKLVVKAAVPEELIGEKQKLSGDSIAVRAFLANRALTKADIKAQPDLKGLLHSPKAVKKTMFISAPIVTQSGVIGIFNLSNKTNGKQYTPKEAETLNRWVARINPSVETAKLIHDIGREKNRLKRANTKLNKLEEVKRDLMNMIVHDMKSPLNEIAANLDLMTMEGLDDLAASYLESAVIGSDSLMRMIGNLLDISRMEEGGLSLNLEAISVDEFTRKAMAASKSVFQLNDLETVINIGGELPELIADKGLLGRVLTNLFTNAVEHSPIGSRVTVGAEHDQNGGVIRFTVSDQGPGVPESAREDIFKKFYQTGDKRRRGGSGLGLAFCSMVAIEHKGRIWVDGNLEGEGSSFKIELPVKGPSSKKKKR